MTIELDGHSLTIEKVIDVARKFEKIAIQSDAMDRIKECRDLLERKISEKDGGLSDKHSLFLLYYYKRKLYRSNFIQLYKISV